MPHADSADWGALMPGRYPSPVETDPSRRPVKPRSNLPHERLSPGWWSNGPGDRYAAHSHTYHKVLYCARGSIRFTLEATGESIDLAPGDRLDLPPGTPHSAVVGPEGVTCVEAAATKTRSVILSQTTPARCLTQTWRRIRGPSCPSGANSAPPLHKHPHQPTTVYLADAQSHARYHR